MRALPLFVGLLVCHGALAAPPASDDDKNVTPPELIEASAPTLPAGVVEEDRTVELWVTIDASGEVTDVTLKSGAGAPWDEVAIATLRRYRFLPATSDGTPIAVKVPFTFRFSGVQARGKMVETRTDRRRTEATPGFRTSGVIVEKGTRTPLVAIPVTVRDSATGRTFEAVTNDRGEYVFEGLPPGILDLTVETGEHAVVRQRIVGRPLGAPEPPVAPVYLDPVGVPKYRTVIKDQRPPAAASEVKLEQEELTRTPGTFGDPTRVIASLPGVSRSPFGLGYYIVRGASFENTGFFIDGHPALFLYHLLGGPGVLYPELVGGITFYPANYPASYGRFASGAILIDTKNPPNDRWHADVDLDLLKVSALGSVPFHEGRGMVTANVRRSYYELILPAITDDVSLSYLDYQFRLTYDFPGGVRARFVALGSEDRVAQTGTNPGQSEERSFEFVTGFHRLLGAAEWDLRKDLMWTNSFVWEHDRSSSVRTSSDDATIDAGFAGYFLQWRSFLDWKPLESFKTQWGLDFFYANIGSDLKIPSLPALGDPQPPIFDPIIVNASILQHFVSFAPYIMADWEPVPGFRVLPGVRFSTDWYAESTRFFVDPRLSLRYKLPEGFTLKASAGMAHQEPPPFQVAKPFGDPTIPPIRATQTSLGLEWAGGEGWEVSLEGFFNYYQNFSRPTGEVGVGDSGSIDRPYWKSDVEGRAFGLEALIRKRLGGRFYGWISYTLSRSERLRPPKDWETYENDQTHILNLAVTVNLGADWSLGTRFTLTSGNLYFPITGSRYDSDRDRYVPVYSGDRERLPVYHRLDIRLDKRWRFDTWYLEAYLDIQNVYNAGNPESQRYSYDFKIRVNGVGIPILPTIGVRAVF